MRRTEQVLSGLRAAVLALGLALAGLLPAALPADAAVVGDPTLTAGAGRFSVGGEADIVLDQDIEPGNGSLEYWSFLGNASYGFTETIEGFVKLGLVTGEIDGGQAGGNVDIDPGFAVGVGGRGSFLERGDLRVGALTQIVFFSSELDAPGSPSIDWWQLDVAPAVSWRGLGQIVPYGGVKLMILRGDVDGGPDFDEDDWFGLFGGATVNLNPNFQLGAEIRLLSETALGVYAKLAF